MGRRVPHGVEHLDLVPALGRERCGTCVPRGRQGLLPSTFCLGLSSLLFTTRDPPFAFILWYFSPACTRAACGPCGYFVSLRPPGMKDKKMLTGGHL